MSHRFIRPFHAEDRTAARAMICPKRSVVERLNPSILAQVAVPFMFVQSVVALAATNRHFRAFFRQEQIWAALNQRDHPFIPPGQQIVCVRAQLIAVRELMGRMESGRTQALRAANECLARLIALQSLLLELPDEMPSFHNCT